MNASRIIVPAIALLLFCAAPAFAQSSEATQPGKPAGDEVVTRADLVTELDRILSNWEKRTESYATKDELNELRALILEMRKELGGLGERESKLRERVDGIEQRADHTGRPGF